MKIALCFLISYNHEVNKEHVWREWIEHNKDIINVYFHYKDLNMIKSPWIKQHAIPGEYIVETSYYHVVNAYLSVAYYAMLHDKDNEQFCFLTEACVPIVPPVKFREIFINNYDKSIMGWKKAWWNVELHKRSNLRLLAPEFRLGNEPWFILSKQDINHCLLYSKVNRKIFKLICKGGLANESIFAIILYSMGRLGDVICEITHCTDWDRPSSPTSPYVFKHGTEENLNYINKFIKENKYTMFLRKVSPEFPDEILFKFLYQ